MTTRSIVPRADGEGSIGTAAKNWGGLWAKKINGDEPNLFYLVRLNSTAYSVGDVAFSPSLPSSFFLKCITAGTTAASEPTYTSPEVGGTVTDGTVVWQYDDLANKDLPDMKNNHNNIFRGQEIPYTWAELKTKVQNGDFSNLYIGDYKQITLTTNEVVICEIAGINNYKGFGSTAIGNHIDFISRDCLATSYQMNTTNTNNGKAADTYPWKASNLFDTLNTGTGRVASTLPSDLFSCIANKVAYLEQRYSSGGAVSSDTGASWTASGGWLWIPSEVEVFGHATWSEIGYGTAGFMQYPIFRLNPSKIIKKAGNGGSASAWWELSASRLNSTNFCRVNSTGDADQNYAAVAAVRVPLCFRIG